MIYFFIAVILLLLCFAFHLNLQFLRNKKEYHKKIAILEAVIIELNNNYEIQNQKMQLSDEVKAKLKRSNESLRDLIYNLNTDLFKALFPKKDH